MDTWSQCPACDSFDWAPLRGFTQQHLRRCRACKLVFDERLPSDDELAEHYRQYSYGTLRPCPDPTRRSYRRLLAEFGPYKRSATLLDVGCGQGDFLYEARELGWDATGTEYSPSAVRLCHERGLRVIEGDFSVRTLGEERFDVVTAFEVIEHVRHPNELLGTIARVLRPGGLFFCTTPNFNAALRHLEGASFEMLGFLDHLCLYTRESLRTTARRHSLSPMRIITTGLDMGRLKRTLRRRDDNPSSAVHRRAGIEQLRANIEARPTLRLAKSTANAVLTWTGMGDTLKGYFRKVV